MDHRRIISPSVHTAKALQQHHLPRAHSTAHLTDHWSPVHGEEQLSNKQLPAQPETDRYIPTI